MSDREEEKEEKPALKRKKRNEDKDAKDEAVPVVTASGANEDSNVGDTIVAGEVKLVAKNAPIGRTTEKEDDEVEVVPPSAAADDKVRPVRRKEEPQCPCYREMKLWRQKQQVDIDKRLTDFTTKLEAQYEKTFQAEYEEWRSTFKKKYEKHNAEVNEKLETCIAVAQENEKVVGKVEKGFEVLQKDMVELQKVQKANDAAIIEAQKSQSQSWRKCDRIDVALGTLVNQVSALQPVGYSCMGKGKGGTGGR